MRYSSHLKRLMFGDSKLKLAVSRGVLDGDGSRKFACLYIVSFFLLVPLDSSFPTKSLRASCVLGRRFKIGAWVLRALGRIPFGLGLRVLPSVNLPDFLAGKLVIGTMNYRHPKLLFSIDGWKSVSILPLRRSGCVRLKRASELIGRGMCFACLRSNHEVLTIPMLEAQVYDRFNTFTLPVVRNRTSEYASLNDIITAMVALDDAGAPLNGLRYSHADLSATNLCITTQGLIVIDLEYFDLRARFFDFFQFFVPLIKNGDDLSQREVDTLFSIHEIVFQNNAISSPLEFRELLDRWQNDRSLQ